MAYYSRKLRMPFEHVLDKITLNLEHQGFGIITTIDVQDTFQKKLNVDFRKYKILGVYNPQFAYKLISLESHMGTMVQCNVVVQEHENGEVEVSAINPLENLDKSLDTTQLVDLATEIGVRLRTSIDCIQNKQRKTHLDALTV